MDNLFGEYEETRKLTYEQFLIFWKSYPRKTGKFLAQKVWSKIKIEEDLFERIMKALEIQKQSDAWRNNNGIYIPHPSTWLNQRRWEDEVLPGKNVQKPTQTEEEILKLEAARKKTQDLMEREWLKRQSK